MLGRLRSRSRRLVVAAVGAATIGGVVVGVAVNASAATTNGDPVTFGKVHCATNLALSQDLDVDVQAVVPNQVAQSTAYTAATPGGAAELPSASSGFNLLGFSNLAQTYMFRASSGAAPIINSAVPSSTHARMQGVLSVTTGGASWSGGTLTVNTGSGTTNADHLLSIGDPVNLTGFAPTGFNISGTVATTPTSHSFTVAGVTNPGLAAPTTNGIVHTDSQVPYGVTFTNVSSKALTAQSFAGTGQGDLSYTTAAAHGLVVNQVIDITGSTPTGYNRNAAVVTAVPDATHFTVAGIPETPYAISAGTYSSGTGLVTITTSSAHGLSSNNVISISGNSTAAWNVSNVSITVTSPTKFTFPIASNPGAIGATKGNVLSPNPGASNAVGSVSTIAGVTLNTPKAIPGVLTTPDVTIGLTSPAANSTITTYVPVITTSSTATIVGLVNVVCPIPHTNPQTDGISATIVGTGGPTTSAQPGCRPVTGACDTTTTTTGPSTSTSTSTTSTSTTSTSTTVPATTTTTTIPTGGTPTCDIGTGPLKNPPGATFKSSPGLLVAPSATKKSNFTIQASLTNCTGFESFATKYPVTAGKLKITVQVPPGSTCDNIQPGFPIKTTLTITFQGINPKNGKLATASGGVKSTLASYNQASNVPLAVDAVAQPFTKTTSPFFSKVANVHLTIDENAAARAALCADKGGLKVLHLNNGPSSLTLS